MIQIRDSTATVYGSKVRLFLSLIYPLSFLSGVGKVRFHSVLLKRLYPYSLEIQTKYVLNILVFAYLL